MPAQHRPRAQPLVLRSGTTRRIADGGGEGVPGLRPELRGNSRLSLLPIFVLAGISMLIVAACGGDPQQAEPQLVEQAQSQPEGATSEAAASSELPAVPLKIGLLLDFSAMLAEYGVELQRGFELAIKHINEAGGVWGRPVESAVGDTALDPTTAVEEARRLIEIERVHGIVGPITSAMALAVTESVSGAARIPTISPVATSSQVTLAEDDDFLFRVALADRVEGRYLAELTAQQGFDNVGLLYRDDAFGHGMATAFEEHFDGTVKAIAVSPDATSYTAELGQSREFEPRALVLVAFPQETIRIVREALELAYYDQFVFGAPARTPGVSEAIGPRLLAGMRGTHVAPAPANPSSDAWMEAYLKEYGAPPGLPYVKETYDATIAIALAAAAARSTDGGAIRDQLRRIGSAPGTVVIPHPESLAEGLKALADGGDVNYQGAAGVLDWDEHGDITRGYIGIWEFAEDGSITELELIEFVAQ